jgi:hypothetical protein
MDEKLRYDFNFLQKYCKNNKIELLHDYIDIKINRDIQIEGNCITENCETTFSKNFRNLILYGGICKKCMKYITNDKRKQTNIDNFGCENPQQNENIKNKSIITCVTKYGCKNPAQNKEIQNKIKNTNMERYGTEITFQSEKVKEKSRQTNLKKYGVEYAIQSLEIKNKIKETNIKKYGNVCPIKNPLIKQKMENTNIKKYGFKNVFKCEEIKEKIKNTCLNKYGVEYPMQSDEIKEKIKNNCLNKYGVNHVTQTNDFKEKIKQTNLEKYGVEYPIQSAEIREKIKQTNLIRYGAENPMQNPEIAEKACNNSYQTKNFAFPSGKIIRCQGYEPFALEELVILNFDEDDIYTRKMDVPKIIFNKNGKESRHYVDIYIKSLNKCIEVKSDWYFNKDKDVVLEKQNAGKKIGYEYEIWVYDNKKNKTIY